MLMYLVLLRPDVCKVTNARETNQHVAVVTVGCWLDQINLLPLLFRRP